MKFLAPLLIFVVFFQSFIGIAFAQGSTNPPVLQFETKSVQTDSGYIDITCKCYAYALDTAKMGEDFAKSHLDESAQCEAAAGNVNAEAWLQHMSNVQAFSFINMVGGMCSSNDPVVASRSFQNSALGMTNSVMTAMMVNPPASSTYYVADIMQHAGLAEPAYAQGIGYSGLSPLIGIWRFFRNFSYVILIIVMIIVGFMIMFRMNLDPQTVITIQSALPGIIITLIVITFSYAIAGVLIDLMYFVMFLLVALFGQVRGLPAADISTLQQLYTNMNVMSLLREFVSGTNVFSLPWEILLYAVPTTTGVGAVTALLGLSAAPIVVGFGAAIGFALPILIITIALFFAFLRVFMILLGAYIHVLINVIFAPLILLRGAIPGNNAFLDWLRGLIANLSVYPTTAGVFLLIGAMATSLKGAGTSMWEPPFLFGPSANDDILIGLISLGMIILAPTFILGVKHAIAPEGGVPVSPGVLLGPAGGLVGRGLGMYTAFHQLGGEHLLQGWKTKLTTPGGQEHINNVSPLHEPQGGNGG